MRDRFRERRASAGARCRATATGRAGRDAGTIQMRPDVNAATHFDVSEPGAFIREALAWLP